MRVAVAVVVAVVGVVAFGVVVRVVRGIRAVSAVVGVLVVVVARAVQRDARARVDEDPVEPRGAHRVVEPALEPRAVDDQGVGIGEREELRGRRVEAVRALRRREELGDLGGAAHELAR